MGFFSDVFDFAFGWLIPDPPTPKAPGAELTSAETDAYIPKIYGKVQKQRGYIAFKETNDADGDDYPNDLLHIIVVWGEAVESIDEVYLDDVPYSSNDEIFHFDSGAKAVFVINFPNGMGAFSDLNLTNAGWRNNDRLDGKACSYIRLEYTGGENAINSEPGLTADLTGTTYSNPATALRDYLTNPIYGKGLSTSFIDLNAIAYGEALSNSDVPETSGSSVMRDLFSCNVALDTSKTVLDNVNTLLKPMRAWLPVLNGKLTLIIEEDNPPVSIPILETDIIEMGKIKEGSKNSRYNRVSVSYRDPEADGSKLEAVYPPKDSAIEATLQAEDNGVVLETSVELETCRNYYEALEFAKTYLEVSRQQTRTTVTLPKWATLYQVGDIVPVSHSFPGWNGKLFRIESTSENREEVELSIREHQPYIYDFYGEGNKPELPDTNYNATAPDAPTDLTIEHIYSNFIQVRVNWVSLAQRFDYRVLDLNGEILETKRIAATSVELKGFALGEYRFQVRALGGLAQRSGWAEIPLVMQEPGVPTSIQVNASNFELEIIPFLAGSDSSTAFKYAISYDVTDSEPPTPVRGPSHTYTFTGLNANTNYKIWVSSFNALGQSAWVSVDALTTANSGPLVDILAPTFAPINFKLEELELSFDDIDSKFIDFSDRFTDFSDRFTEFEALTLEIQKQEQVTREQAEALLLQSISENAAYQLELARRIENGEALTDAVVYRDPTNGLIVNRAFEYADDKFTEAALIIDGVSGEINAAVQRIESTEDEITNLSSELALIPGAITATATAIVSESLSALEPAHAFNFFDSAQGWQAVNGTLTTGVNEITLTHGDIENDSLNYAASDNKLIRVSIERLAGSGWAGTVIIERDDSNVETFTNYVSESSILLIDFTAIASYSGTITRVRLVLGTSPTDEFKITSIVIGKADATTQDLANITARVTQAEVAIDANNAEIAQRVSTSFFNNNAVTFSNVEQTINALDSVIALEATRQTLIDNDVVTKANSAALFINGASGTIQQIVQTFEQDVDAVETSITDVQQQINGLGITEQVAGIASTQIQTYDVQSSLLQQAANDLSNYLADAENEQSVAVAVNQLQIDVSPAGALAKDISSLQAATVINNTAITASNQRLSQVETNASGNASAIEQLNLEVSGIEGSLSGALNRIDAVEIEAGDNASAISALQGRASSIEGDVSSNFTLATQAKATAEGNATAINQVQLDVLGLNNALGSAINRIDSVEIDADANATAISSLQGTATAFEGDIEANFTLAQQAKTTADSADGKADTNATAISSLQGTATALQGDIEANFTLAQQAKTTADSADGKADTNATAITNLETTVNNATTGLSATNSLAQSASTAASDAEGKADANATALQQLTNTVEDANSGLSATNTIAQQAKTTANSANSKADTNATAITSISSRVTDAENDATAALTLASGLDTELEEYRAIAQLAVDANGNVSLIQLDATPTMTQILFKAAQLVMVDQDDNPRVFWDNSKGRFVFDGELRANSGYFKGLLQSASSENIGSNFMELSNPDGFGPDNLSYYYGPKFLTGTNVNYSQATKANATQWRDTDGDSYFGGSLSAGVLSASTQNPSIGLNPTAEIGPFSTNGNQKQIVFSMMWQGDYLDPSACPAQQPTNPSATLTLQRSIGGGSWVTIQTRTITGTVTMAPFSDDGTQRCNFTEEAAGSFTYTDTSSATGTFSYRVVVSNQYRHLMQQFITRQILSIISTEE